MYYLLLTLYTRTISTLIIQLQAAKSSPYFMKSLQHFKWKELHDSISGISAFIIDTEAAVTLCEKKTLGLGTGITFQRRNSKSSKCQHHQYENFS